MEQIQRITSFQFRGWLESLRPRTLPLAFASILTGSALAWWQHHFSLTIALLCFLTSGLLQVLSNLANDYGDALKGSDGSERLGPLRGIQKGIITLPQLRRGMMLVASLALICGIMLISQACHTLGDVLSFLLLGALAVVAAIAYTVGKKPYGYLGLGDLSVLIFFGWLGVGGSFYLQSHNLPPLVLLPATACGLLAAAVLNINNLRDIETDRQCGKMTLAVRLGADHARRYHALLLGGALLCFAVFAWSGQQGWGRWLFLLVVPLLWQQGRYILQQKSPQAMRPMLEKTVKAALLTNILFAVGVLLS
ncbi:1,4-dihydroxy-2-naphthoate polyprenyltransferase [Mixta tenebrionis]|uniref:1,4-dihydroxy-2-naphthoate octaprenyltransferase n=1 Tax=Mixta tenebrionis TaxID=2562439 RepID=A0A506V502_9GAMM|nr:MULTISPECIES: 1,4-dihydroxy-2-naphthoate polyprenyltransferase [Mixta]QHM77724.1 1,4-dihydroxy-2-naphthoate octaprenyltransferase [Mixta theicola]TPW40509.1 1,4-dihydroxy-2-naphthoate polyprenyltransferase [Mixta tenebrionis]